MKHYLTIEDEKGRSVLSSKVIRGGIKVSATEEQILRELTFCPQYPAQLAKKLGIPEQKVYYHISRLQNQGMLEVVEKKEIRGTTARLLSPTAESFTLALKEKGNPEALLREEKTDKLSLFLASLVDKGVFMGNIVVGNPDPHGPFKARARDGHYAIDLALFLGKRATSKDTVSLLDTQVNLNSHFSSLLIVGGPVTNQLVEEFNPSLPVKFSQDKPWGLISERTHQHYTDDAVGLIARVPNPHFPDKIVIILAGIRYSGTRAAILGVIKYADVALSRFTGQKRFASVVQGVDMNGDGEIDTIDLLE
ncbi:hypothetical protein J4460_00150 [Candidatus Woesearchaeota archaeon]|nr:MAG: ArsR family transcriptional regulator [archaeon GW2011_AR4]MBS3129061.1 hypothetical protein [Candidatus Woesearchaeota archaeon]HIH37795.1 hypothetical protein [Candidatus Woesearchaeota archaeon]HIH49522.1 hypothetical protein [Candidatus Woesearchaeota archaeon]HIJ03920.1 hypothetical protein [Candidatus Woesearchaeota archaeon]